MSEKILVPELGESISEATVSKWLKSKGDKVTADEAIVELETDKVNLEVPAPISGLLTEVNWKDGDTVEVGAVLGIISNGDVKNTKSKIEKIEPKKVEKKEEPKEEKNNVINLDLEKKSDLKFNEEPLILTDEEEPLILTDEVVKKVEPKKKQ